MTLFVYKPLFRLVACVLASVLAMPPTLYADGLRVQLVPGTNQVTVILQNTSQTNDYHVLRKTDLGAPVWTLERQVPGLDSQTTALIPTNYRPTAFFAAKEIPAVTN